MSTTVRPKRERPEADWDLVFKRNPVERIKRDKAPLGIRDELPALIAAGYEAVAEEDIVRLQWWGLYHDKPKIGTFMLRVKLPAGFVEPDKLRAIGEVSNRFGRGVGELATRQNVQLHHLALDEPARRLRPPRRRRASRRPAAAATPCATSPARRCRASTRSSSSTAPTSIQQAADFFYGNPDFSNLPRKHKYSIAATPDRDNAPEINCIALVGAIHEGQEGFGVLVGGGLSSVPRIAQELGVFVPKDEAVEVLAAITGAWAADLNYRVSRVKARLKFMIDDIGPEGMRERVEDRLGRRLADFDAAGARAGLARPPRRQRAEAARA